MSIDSFSMIERMIPRVIAGLLALICAAVGVVFGQGTIAMISTDSPWGYAFGIRMTPVATGIVALALLLVAVWLIVRALRDGLDRPA